MAKHASKDMTRPREDALPRADDLVPGGLAEHGRHLAQILKGDSETDVLHMIKCRAEAAGLPASTCRHTFRATGITAYLKNGGTIENAQAIAAHESPRTTKLYDRTSDEISLDEVERILI